MSDIKEQFAVCGDCGMVINPSDYHPFAACLMFKQTRNKKYVDSNLNSVIEYGKAKNQAEITRLTAEVAELKSESGADEFSIALMSKLLAEICLTVKGEPPYLTRFSYHDLPQFVKDLKADAERYRFLRDENNMKKSNQFNSPFIATHTNSFSAWVGIDADNVVDKAMLDAAIKSEQKESEL